MKKVLLFVILCLTTNVAFAQQWVPMVTVPPIVPQIVVIKEPVIVYKYQLVPVVQLIPVTKQKVGVFGRIIGEEIIMTTVTTWEYRVISTIEYR